MNLNSLLNKRMVKSGAIACLLALCGGAALAQGSVTLVAGTSNTTLPDGQTVPMWGYTCGDALAAPASAASVNASCTAMNGTAQSASTWQPPLITLQAGQSLTITLINNLQFGTNNIATSIVIDGQLGGGLGKERTTMPSPQHLPQGTTWPGTLGIVDTSAMSIMIDAGGSGYSATNPPAVSFSGGGGSGAVAIAKVSAGGAVTGVVVTSPGSGYTSAPTLTIASPGGSGTLAKAHIASLPDFLTAGSATFVPPPQADRVKSLATEVVVGTPGTLTWNNLRPGTYLLHSGTQPSIQHPMGLYGVLVVTESPAGSAYGTGFDKDVALLFSEIDPAQNREVAQVVQNSAFSDTQVWDGQPGKCADITQSASAHTCYPPVINYSPLYFLVNGQSFDRSKTGAGGLSVPKSIPATSGNVLLRMVNAGLRMHVPQVVNKTMALLAEDGNKLPGAKRYQSSVAMPAGKTYEVAVQPAQTNTGTYDNATLAVYDRQLSLSTANQRDGGMQTYIKIGDGADTGSVGGSASSTTLNALDKTYYCSAGVQLVISDRSKGLLGGTVGANGVALNAYSTDANNDINASTLTLQPNGTFTYTPSSVASAAGSCGGSFTFLVNGTKTQTATIAQCDANSTAAGCSLAAAPSASNVVFTSNIASRYVSSPPGVLGSNVLNPGGLALTAVGSATGLHLNVDGSFAVAGPGTADACAAAVPAITTAGASCVNFGFQAKNAQGTLSNAAVATVVFLPATNLAVNVLDAKNGTRIKDYRWIIEEDRTFWIDPKCQVNSLARPAGCPDLPVESLGYNFHTANMPVIAQGCVGKVSCESQQTVGGTAAVCDIGNGQCRTDGSTQKTPLDPASVHLDPTKRYFISVLPGDGINPTIGGAGGPGADGKLFDIGTACGPYNGGTGAWEPAGSSAMCGHEMGGSQITPSQTAVTINLQQTPLPTAKISVFVFQDDNPLNGENDAGGGVDVIAPNEAGLSGFEIKLFDQAGQLGDNTGQITYDMFNQPVSNALAGYIDPVTTHNACPITARKDGIIGMVPTCPKYEDDGKTLSPLAGQAVIVNLYPGLYEIQAYPAADRIAKGEQWLQTNTLDGGKPHEAFIKPNEPGYFQEFGPGGFHVAIGFANPAIINARKDGYCKSTMNPGGTCTSNLTVEVTNNHMSRTPDQRTYDTESYDHYSFTQCYVSIGPADAEDFAIQPCVFTTDSQGRTHATVTFTGMPAGTFKMSVFDQWNDIMLDGLVGTVVINGGDNKKTFPVTQWRTNLYTRTFVDTDGSGVSDDSKPGLALVNTNIRYRDGAIAFFNNTDLNGYAGFNEVFPFMNWLVVETTQTRFKPTWVHSVYDAGGPVDGSLQDANTPRPAGSTPSNIAANLANTDVRVPLPADLRFPGAKYCDNADCPADDKLAGASSGTLFPGQSFFSNTMGWQGLLGQNTFLEFGVKPFKTAENGGIHGNVIYASTRPFDDPSLLLQLSWEPGVPRVKLNLYKKDVDASGNEKLTLADSTLSTSFDDWAQGFRRDKDGKLITTADGKYIPNMNCPGQDAGSPFFATLQGSKMYLDTPDASGKKKPLAYNAQFKCYDGWSQLNQAQPAPYDGYYKFPSVTAIDPANGKPSLSNCLLCTTNPDDGSPMLPAGKYVVEVVVPSGYELVKEEDKNILMGDVFIAPVTQQFAGFGNVFIMPDQAQVNSAYNGNSPGGLNKTKTLGSVTFPRHEGDTGSVEAYWPCVGAERIVPDFNSLFPQAGQAAPFAGAKRRLCDRKEVTLDDQSSVLAKFYVFSSTHIAGHFTGTITNDFASEFDPFSPQFGEKFGPPNLPVGIRDFNGNEVARVYSDQWGIYNGLYFSSWSVNPPNPTGYAPQMSIACMNDPGPIPDGKGGLMTDPSYNPAYSNFCYEQPFMPGVTTYMDTPVIPTQAFADGYNLPDTEYPDLTPAIKTVVSDKVPGPWLPSAAPVSSIALTSGGSGYSSVPAVTITATDGIGSGAAATATMKVTSITVSNAGSGYTSRPTVAIAAPATGATATVNSNGVSLTVLSVSVTQTGACRNGFNHDVSFNGGNGFGARANATFANGKVTAINVNRGGNYGGVPTVSVNNCSGLATSVNMGVGTIPVANAGSGYTSQPTVTIAGGGGSGAGASALMGVNALTLTAGGFGYDALPVVGFSGSFVSGGTAAAAKVTLGNPVPNGALTITSLGDKVVQNPNFAGPNANSAPYNLKTITRHYGFGGAGTAVLFAPDAVTNAQLNVSSWSDTTISATLPALPNAFNCKVQQQGAPTSQCGQLVITRNDNGKQSIDAITVNAGGSAPWVVSPTGVTPPANRSVNDYGSAFGRMNLVPGAVNQSPIQVAIDSAAPGDLILVQPGTYRENLIMWKPVRLQGVGATAVTINADAHPAGHMDQWRRQMVCAFGLTLQGIPNLGNSPAAFDPSGQYSCPDAMFLKGDRIPFEAITGWDASGNGNLAQVLQEPTLLGAYEGAGITVVGRGVRVPAGSQDFWGADPTAAGAFADGSAYLGGAGAGPQGDDCRVHTNNVQGIDYGTSNYRCNPSRVDGVSIMNSSQGGGGLFVHGWGHNLEVSNTRISSNHGTLAGAINLGNGETPPVFVNDGTTCGANTTALCPPIPAGTPTGAVIPFGFNTNVRIHHNMLYNNASIGDALFTGTPAGAGGVTVSAGGDSYQIDHNWIAGNLSTGDGGGLQTLGVTFNGRINNNVILFNQSTNPTLPTNGGGIVIQGANEPRTLNGTECGGATDTDCPPGLGDGTGQGLVIDSNLIYGNSAESGTGGGIALEQINGSELIAFPNNPNNWYAITLTNNIIANNVAGYDGGGVSMRDALKLKLVNNTIISNDTTASAGVLFKTLGAINSSNPPPGCNAVTDPTLPQSPTCTGDAAPHGQQPSGLVTMLHTQNLIEAIASIVPTGGNPQVTCPSGYGYTNGTGTGGLRNGDCVKFSRPALVNDLFWQNRTFRVDIQKAGSGLQSQQNLVVITPQLTQGTTGECASGAQYWDIGLRTDDVNTGIISAAVNKLVITNSILTGTGDISNLNEIVASSTNKLGVSNPVVAQVCNGARVPPEYCGSRSDVTGGQNGAASCKGFNAPPGASESTSNAQQFTFGDTVGGIRPYGGIQPTATVDEGHNWLNLVYGPLTLSRPNVSTTTSQEYMVAGPLVGTELGAYSIPAGSPAVAGGTNSATGVPALDFYGNSRSARNDIGAVQYVLNANAELTPSNLAFDSTYIGTSSIKTIKLTTGTTALTGIAVSLNQSGAAYSVLTGNAGDCGATLAATANAATPSSCVIRVQFAPTAAGLATGSVTVTANIPVTGSPVALTGDGVSSDLTVAPASLSFAGYQSVTLPVQFVTVTNTSTGNVTVTGIAPSITGSGFSRSGGTCLTAPFSLVASASCTIGVSYTGTAPGTSTGGVTVTADAAFMVGGSTTLSGTTYALPSVSPTSLAFGHIPSGKTAVARTLTITNPLGAPALTISALNFSGNGFSRATGTATGSCATTLAAGSTCTVGVVYTAPTTLGASSGSLAITTSAPTVTGSAVTLTGTSVAVPAVPTPPSLDQFNRASSNTLGSNWYQATLLGAAAIRVNDVTNAASGTAQCTGGFLPSCTLGGWAYWGNSAGGTVFGDSQAASFTFSGTPADTPALLLKSSGTPAVNVYPTGVRVRYTGTNVAVETNVNGGGWTTQATLTATFAGNDKMTAQVDNNGNVYVWKTTGTSTSVVDSVPLGDTFGSGVTGAIGFFMTGTSAARVDNFAGGIATSP